MIDPKPPDPASLAGPGASGRWTAKQYNAFKKGDENMQYQKPEIVQLGKATELIMGEKGHGPPEIVVFRVPFAASELDD